MSEFDRIKKHLAAVVESLVGRRLDYSAYYPAKVVRQSGETLEVRPDDARIAGNGLAGVPIRHGLPGTRTTVAPGARVLIGFENQDPKKPFAALWDTNAAFVDIEIGGNLPVARQGDMVLVGGPTSAMVFQTVPPSPPATPMTVGIPYVVLSGPIAAPISPYQSGVISSGNPKVKS